MKKLPAPKENDVKRNFDMPSEEEPLFVEDNVTNYLG